MKVGTKNKVVVPAGNYVNAFAPLNHILVCKKLPVRPIDAEHVDALLQSIKKTGLDNPLDIWAGESEDTKVKIGDETVPATFIIAGLHRREALKRLNLEEPAVYAKLFPNGVPIRKRVCPVTDAMLLQLRENVTRREMTSEEILPVVKNLVEAGIKQNVIANRVGKSTAWVSSILTVGEELGEEGMEEVAKGGIPIKAAKKAAAAVSASKKAGTPISGKEALKTAKAEHEEAKGGNAVRAKKKVSLKVLWDRYIAMPQSKITQGLKLQILEGIVEYALGTKQRLPEQVRAEIAKPAAKAAK